MKKIVIVLFGLLLGGCVSIPSTHITGNLTKGTFKITAPKDYQIGVLDVSANTNGVVSVHLGNLQATNSSGVIASSASGQVDVINAVSSAINNAVQTGVNAAIKSTVKP